MLLLSLSHAHMTRRIDASTVVVSTRVVKKSAARKMQIWRAGYALQRGCVCVRLRARGVRGCTRLLAQVEGDVELRALMHAHKLRVERPRPLLLAPVARAVHTRQ